MESDKVQTRLQILGFTRDTRIYKTIEKYVLCENELLKSKAAKSLSEKQWELNIILFTLLLLCFYAF